MGRGSAYKNILSEILKLIDSGRIKNISELIENKLPPMFKGKILTTYFPEEYVSVFSPDHINHYIDKLDLLEKDYSSLDPIEKREVINDFKKSDSVMKNWSMYEFSHFLYECFGEQINEEDVPEELKDYIDDIFPPLNKVRPIFFKTSVDNLPESVGDVSSDNRRFKRVDFESENRKNLKIGSRGEAIVIMAEKDYLRSINRVDLANKVSQISKCDDSAGFDILSFDEQGNEKFIEVKSSKSSPPVANFQLSSNQLDKSKKLNNYFIYIVFEANRIEPKIVKLKNPFTLPENKIKITPTMYRVIINLKQK